MGKYTIRTAGRMAIGLLQIAGGVLLLSTGTVRFFAVEIWRRVNGEVPVFAWLVLAAIFAAVIYLFYLGIMNFRTIKRCKRLVSLLSAQKETLFLSQVLEQSECSKAALLRGLTRMKKQRYFQNVCVLEDCIVLESPGFDRALMINADESRCFIERKCLGLGGQAIYEVKRKAASQTAERTDAESDPVQDLIWTGTDILKQISHKVKHIDNAHISTYVNDIAATAGQMLAFAEKKPERYSVIRHSVEYYLPTISELLSEYQELGNQTIKGNNILIAMNKIEEAMGMVAENLKMELDGLYLDKMIDITVDIEVMENIMKEKRSLLWH